MPKSRLLYGHHRLPPAAASVVVVECPWGVMRLAQLRIPAVALLGTQLSRVQLDLLSLRHRIVLLLDGDRAGRRATAGISARLRARTCVTTAAHLPAGCDPDDLDDLELWRLLAPLLL